MMNKKELEDILQNGYNRNTFKEMINYIFKKDIFYYSPDGNCIGGTDFNTRGVKYLKILEYKVADDFNLERNRVTINKKALSEDSNDSDFLAVYYNEATALWRLSLVKFDYSDNKEKTTSLKRYTYLLGKDIPVKTAVKQIYDELLNKKVNSVDDLLNAFSVEPVTKDFFNEIGKYFTKLIGGERKIGTKKFVVKDEDRLLKQYPLGDHEDEKKFAVRLIGRIVFVWFLKKKDLIPEELLSSKAVEKNKNYYHSILEKLFFEVLNKKLDIRLESIKNDKLFQKIPFLNGGLFDAQRDDCYKLNSMDETEFLNTLRVDDSWFKELFEIFEQYNFTIDESTLYDVDISIDPEILGRIFENLLAEINPETGKSARKASGSYYTPREIVDYMVTESLKEYFYNNTTVNKDKIDNIFIDNIILDDNEKKEIVHALAKIKILDPAVGSGAFPMGILQKIFFILKRVDKDNKIWKKKKFENIDPMLRKQLKKENLDYIRKLGVIRDSIYGVDIQPIAIDISRLRFFLSLIVDQKIDDSKDNRGVLALPNLDFKFVAANSLIGLEKEKKSLFGEPEEIKLLKEIRNEFFTVSGEDKYTLEKRYNSVRKQLLTKYLTESYTFSENSKKITNWNPFNDKSSDFFDSEWMFGVKGFDIVIGNPPYLRVQGIDKKYSEIFKKSFKAATGSYDLYVLFVEKALSLLSKDGIINYIMPHLWINSAYGKGLRKIVGSKISKLISFGAYQVFNASTYTSLLWVQNKPTNKLYYNELTHDIQTNQELEIYLNNLNENSFTNIETRELGEEAWILTDKGTYKILQYLKKQPLCVKDIFSRIFQGLKTSADNIYILHNCIVDDGYLEGYSEYLDKNIIIERELVKPVLKGNAIHRYETLKISKYVVFPYLLYIDEGKDKAELYSEDYLAKRFPKGYDYLKSCKDYLSKRERGRFNIDGEWFQFGRKQGIIGVEHLKIILGEISYGGSFTVDNNAIYHVGQYSMLKYPNIKGSDKFYIAILNSKVCWFFMKNTASVLSGGYYTYRPNYLNPFPIPKIENIEDIKPFEILVDYIMLLKTLDKPINEYVTNEHIIKSFEEVLDAMVYELYFKEEFESKLIQFEKEKGYIKFIEYAKEDYASIEGLDETKAIETIEQSYKRLKEPYNEIRNNLILLGIYFKDLIVPIMRSL